VSAARGTSSRRLAIPPDRVDDLRALSRLDKTAAQIAAAMHVTKLDVVIACGAYGVSLGRINDHCSRGVGPVSIHAQAPGRERGFGANDQRAQNAADFGGYVLAPFGNGRLIWKPGRYRVPFAVAPGYKPPRVPVAYDPPPLWSLGEDGAPGPQHGPVTRGPQTHNPAGSWGGRSPRIPRGVSLTNMRNAPIMAAGKYVREMLDDPNEAERQRRHRVTKRERPAPIAAE
jgi:hypothetical protein